MVKLHRENLLRILFQSGTRLPHFAHTGFSQVQVDPGGTWPSRFRSPAFLPIIHPPTLQVVEAHPLFLFILIVVLGHLRIYFSPPLRLLSVPASDMCAAETTARQEREEEACDLLHTSSQDGRCVEGGVSSMRVVCVAVCACRPCAKVGVPASKRGGLARKWMSGSRAGPSCTSSAASSPRLLASGD